METQNKNKIDNTGTKISEVEIKEDAKKRALEALKDQKVSVINIKDLVEVEAHKAADSRMAESKSHAGILKNIWKHTFFDEFYRQREVNKVRDEIKNTGDLYAGRKNNVDKTAHDNAMNGISERFISEYEGTLSKGEEKKVLDDKNPETVKTNTEIKNLVINYAKGALSEEAFKNEKVRILSTLKEQDILKGSDNYADNLFEIAKNARLAIEHGAKIEELDFDTNIIIGKAKSSLKTEAHFNMVDKLVDNINKSKVGRFVSPAVVSTALALAYSVSVGMGTKVLRSKAMAYGTLGAAVAVSSLVAGAQKSHDVTEDRARHGLEMAEGSKIEADSKYREKIDQYQYKMEDSNDLADNLRSLMFEKDKDGKEVFKDFKEEDLGDIFKSLSNIEARNSLNAKNKIDLISYSKIGNVEKERTDLTILTARAKVELRKKIEGSMKGGIPSGETFDSYFAKQTQVVEDSLLGGEKGISAQDKAFSRFKTKEVAKKMVMTAIIGLTVGAVVQEGVAFFKDDTQGLVEGLMGKGGDHNTIQTPLENLHGWITGHSAHLGMTNAVESHINGNNFKLPEGTSLLHNSDGTYDILRGDEVISDNVSLNFDASGNLDNDSITRLGHDGIIASTTHTLVEGTKEIQSSADDYLKNHPGQTTHIARDGWYDNNTPKPIFDQNELKLQWGGAAGSTGIDANGNYVMDVSHMTSDGSFHQDFSVDAQNKIKEGGLKLMLSLTQGTQAQVFEVPIDIHGNAVINPNSEIGKLFFGTENGQAIFRGRFAEVMETFGSKDGVEHVKSLATLVGSGNDSIPDIIPTCDDIPVTNLDLPLGTEPPYFIPFFGRKHLEKLQQQKEKTDKNSVLKDSGEKIVGPLEKDLLVDKEEDKEKQKKINEISALEYGGMADDLKMLNKKIQYSKGIITLEDSDFKSEYGKKRYLESKHIAAGMPVTFNKTELQTIGDEMDGYLSNSKILASKEAITKAENEAKEKEEKRKEDLRDDLKMLNQMIRDSKGIISLEASSFKSEYGIQRYNELKSIGKDKPVNFNKTELEKIGTEMEKQLSGPKESVKKQEFSDVLKVEKTEAEKKFTAKDLSQIGTEYIDKEGFTYKVSKVSKGVLGWMGLSDEVEIQTQTSRKDKNGKEILIAHTKSELEREFTRGNIKITKVKV